MNERGFTLIEWLIASTLVIIVAGAVFAAIAPVRDVVERTRYRGELVMGARGALDLLMADLREAGSRAAVARLDDDPSASLPPVSLMASLDSAGVTQPATAVIIRLVPLLGAQARLAAAAIAGENMLRVDTASRCFSGSPACGFLPGDRAVVFADAAAAAVTIANVFNGLVVLDAPITTDFRAGAVLCRLVSITYGIRAGDDGAYRLVRLTDAGAEQPLLDNVVGFDIYAGGPDASRPRHLDVRLRVQAAPDDLRGPAGYLFRRAGTANSVRRWLPDVELRTIVALRNSRGLE